MDIFINVTYVKGLRPLEIFKFLQCADRLYTSGSDVYRCQILAYKVGPRTKRFIRGQVSDISVHVKSYVF